MGGWWRWALVSPDGVVSSQMVGVSASVNLLLHHHKVQKFSSGTGSAGCSRKKDHKTVVVIVGNREDYQNCSLLYITVIPNDMHTHVDSTYKYDLQFRGFFCIFSYHDSVICI